MCNHPFSKVPDALAMVRAQLALLISHRSISSALSPSARDVSITDRGFCSSLPVPLSACATTYLAQPSDSLAGHAKLALNRMTSVRKEARVDLLLSYGVARSSWAVTGEGEERNLIILKYPALRGSRWGLMIACNIDECAWLFQIALQIYDKI